MNRQVEAKMIQHRYGWQLALVVAVILSAGLWMTASDGVFAQAGYDYTVQEGDSWDTVASDTGVSVTALQAANPEAAERESGWLLVGESLTIPSAVVVPTRTHRVGAGESWNSIASQYGISTALLRAANTRSIRAGNILYRGEELIIPTPGASAPVAAPTSTATDEATAEVEASETTTMTDETAELTPTVEAVEEETVTTTPTAEEEETVTATPTPEEEETVTATPTAEEETLTETMTETVEVTVTATVTVEAASEVTSTATMTDSTVMTEAISGSEVVTTTTDETMTELALDLPECPERFADYPEVMTGLINSTDQDGVEAVVAFLSSCKALVDEGTQTADLTGDGVDELLVVYQNPSEEQIFVEGDLVIFNSTDAGYVLGYRARAAGEVRLLTVEDINLDELPDVAWVDTTCGASTCFDTVNVRSWDGSTWADWTDGTITMAYAEINLTDVSEAGLGNEIALEGGIYGSVGAGPQRSRTEIWASIEGGPYSLVEKAYGDTPCLYHTVLDANRAFLDAPTNGFETAVTLYTQAVEDETLTKCWVRNDELAELRSFSLFRLAVIAGYSGDSTTAAAQIAELTAQHPGSIYDEVGQLWLQSYEGSEDAALACADVTAFAEEDSLAWEMLADYGYTNPSFEAVDVCPILDLSSAAEVTE